MRMDWQRFQKKHCFVSTTMAVPAFHLWNRGITYVLFTEWIYELRQNFICYNVLSQVVTVICKSAKREGGRLLNTRNLCACTARKMWVQRDYARKQRYTQWRVHVGIMLTNFVILGGKNLQYQAKEGATIAWRQHFEALRFSEVLSQARQPSAQIWLVLSGNPQTLLMWNPTFLMICRWKIWNEWIS